MKIKVRKVVEKVEKYQDEETGKIYTDKYNYENGFVEELEINPKDISAFSLNKSTRLIGVGKNLYPLTLKSWKETKKELEKTGILSQLDFSKR